MNFPCSSSSSSCLFNIPSFPLLSWTWYELPPLFFYPLPYLQWCLTSSCLLPLPYSRYSLAYLLAFYLLPPLLSISVLCRKTVILWLLSRLDYVKILLHSGCPNGVSVCCSVSWFPIHRAGWSKRGEWINTYSWMGTRFTSQHHTFTY